MSIPTVERVKQLGAFGDAFGVLNTLFSGLAFSAVAVSLHLQFRQNQSTQAELREQRRRIAVQSFESIFFQLLTLYLNNTHALEVRMPSTTSHRGREVFFVLYHAWKDRLHLGLLSISDPQAITPPQHFLYFRHCFSHVLDLHFGLLYELVRYLDQENPVRRAEYGRLVRSHMSSYECALLLYYAKSEASPDSFPRYIEEFALLERTPDLPEIDFADILRYGKQAFGGNQMYDSAVAARAAAA